MRFDRPILSIIGLVLTLAAGPTQAERVSISCSALGVELQLCREGVEAWARETGHQITIISTPNSATERLALYQQLLATGAPDIDVLQIDAIWPGILSKHLIDLRPYSNGAEQNHFPVSVQNNTVNGRLVAMPWYIDAGLLYYRKDLLEKYGEPVPETWEALTATAKKIQEAERAAGNSRLWGFVWQARAYEGLTCNALEWVASHRGGTLIDEQGKITIHNPHAVTALTLAASWITTISPKGVLNYGEEESRGVFQSGNAVFMRNWPYAWALAQSEGSPVKGKIGLAALPKGGADGRHAATLGGWQLAVSKYSRHPELAAALVMYLTSPAEQKRRALSGAYNPTLPSLYQDPEILQANPSIGTLYETFVNAVTRPSPVAGPRYNQISFEFWSAVYTVLTGKTPAQDSLARLEQTLQRISHGGRW
jgi:trehalose/maltose transport system substrate-binding protein